MKFIAKLALLVLALLLNIQEQTIAMRLNQQMKTFEDGDDAGAEAEAEAAPAEEKTADAKPEKKEEPKKEAKEQASKEEKAADKKEETAPKKEGEKSEKKEGKKGEKTEQMDQAARDAEDTGPPVTLGNPGIVAGQSHSVDAMQDGPCEERLNITEYEMIKQMEYFSRRLDIDYFNNAMEIWKNLTKDGKMDRPLMVHTWELYDKAFSFPRVRRYSFVQENLDMLEHFEDNLNTNVSNKQNLANFLRVANTVRHNLSEKYGPDGGFNDPAAVDPYEPKEDTWATVRLPEPVY